MPCGSVRAMPKGVYRCGGERFISLFERYPGPEFLAEERSFCSGFAGRTCESRRTRHHRPPENWMGGRVVECARLESVLGLTVYEGSNPSPSATSEKGCF